MMMMFKSAVYRGDELLGEVEVYPPPQRQGGGDEEEKKRKLLMEEVLKDRIRISYSSPPSDRCPPLAVLHAITGNGIGFKMETKSKDTQISLLHSSCIRDNKVS